MIQGRTDAARKRCAPRRPDSRAGQLPAARWFLLFCLALAVAGRLRGAEPAPSADQAGAAPHYNVQAYAIDGNPLLPTNTLAPIFSRHTGTNISLEEIVQAAADVGLDTGTVRADLASDKDVALIEQEAQQAKEAGIEGVPCFIVSGPRTEIGVVVPEGSMGTAEGNVEAESLMSAGTGSRLGGTIDGRTLVTAAFWGAGSTIDLAGEFSRDQIITIGTGVSCRVWSSGGTSGCTNV